MPKSKAKLQGELIDLATDLIKHGSPREDELTNLLWACLAHKWLKRHQWRGYEHDDDRDLTNYVEYKMPIWERRIYRTWPIRTKRQKRDRAADDI